MRDEYRARIPPYRNDNGAVMFDTSETHLIKLIHDHVDLVLGKLQAKLLHPLLELKDVDCPVAACVVVLEYLMYIPLQLLTQSHIL